MFKMSQLKAVRDGMSADVDFMQGILARLDSDSVRIKSDGTRHDDFIKEKVDEARAKALPQLGEKLGTFGSRLEAVKAQRKFWESKPMILSLQTFDSDVAKDAQIRAAKLAELASMDSPLLQLTADSALEDADLPTIYQCYLASRDRHGTPGWRGLSLDDVVIPEQAEALQIIQQCTALTMQAEDIAKLASGGGLTPTRRLQTARASQS
ncbi:MAG: hypothetical protein K8H75_16660 [Sulfuricella sp.]|nr:hypothetical protein [Sulfuricella sp.]